MRNNFLKYRKFPKYRKFLSFVISRFFCFFLLPHKGVEIFLDFFFEKMMDFQRQDK
jgi:hypothetical protein